METNHKDLIEYIISLNLKTVMRLSFRKRILAYFLLVFVLYTVCIIYFEQEQEKEYRTAAIQARLDGYSELVHNYMDTNKLNAETLSEIVPIIESMPKDLRITIIDNDGKVMFDKDIANYNKLENHLDRVEIKGALYQPFGTNIRTSASNNIEYLYYAKHYSNYYVRVALPYNVTVKNLLHPDNYFIYTTIALFALVLILLYFATSRFSRSILDLKRLTRMVKDHEVLPKDIEFTDDELGDISKQLVTILEQKDKAKVTLETEREKLRKHFQYSEEGLGIFNADYRKIYVNTHFFQFANILTEGPTLNVDTIFDDESFAPIKTFLDNRREGEKNYSSQISKNGKIFLLKVIVFEDNSFEITIKDTTKIEKNRILKQEMTSNIAHELRTPVTALRGYLETLYEQELPQEKQKYFIEKTHQQAIRLSGLIEDVSLLSKIEEQSASYEKEKVTMSTIVDNVRINSIDRLKSNETKFVTNIADDVIVEGNYNLLFSSIQNLVDNSLNYAGKGAEIHIDCYNEDSEYYYFSYYDTGKGVDEEHLNKLFERFYRIDEGRDRNSGGSGLGLSIVKNALLLHKGKIQAKKHISGGLEFLFTIRKKNS